jgi:Spy/CpxP family protein refolding chaperone
MTRPIRPLLLLALTTLVVAAAAAQPGPAPRAGAGHRGGPAGPAGDGPGWRLERLTARLDLSEEQQAAIAALQEEARTEATALRKELTRLRHARRGEMLEDDPSEQTLVELVEKMGAVRTDLQVLHLKTRLQIREQLTPEQRDRMLLLGERGRRGGRPGGRHAGPGWCGGPCDQGERDRWQRPGPRPGRRGGDRGPARGGRI